MEQNTTRYDSAWWSIDLPQGWLVKQDSDCVTFTSPDLAGALQISSYRKDEAIREVEIAELSDERTVPHPIKIGCLTGLCSASRADGVFWKKWWLVEDRTLIFATYNGPVAQADAEVGAAERALRTLQVRH
jgi:hypothetical protein